MTFASRGLRDTHTQRYHIKEKDLVYPHRGDEQKKVIRDGTNLFRCSFCDYNTKSSRNIGQHSKTCGSDSYTSPAALSSSRSKPARGRVASPSEPESEPENEHDVVSGPETNAPGRQAAMPSTAALELADGDGASSRLPSRTYPLTVGTGTGHALWIVHINDLTFVRCECNKLLGDEASIFKHLHSRRKTLTNEKRAALQGALRDAGLTPAEFLKSAYVTPVPDAVLPVPGLPSKRMGFKCLCVKEDASRCAYYASNRRTLRRHVDKKHGAIPELSVTYEGGVTVQEVGSQFHTWIGVESSTESAQAIIDEAEEYLKKDWEAYDADQEPRQVSYFFSTLGWPEYFKVICKMPPVHVPGSMYATTASRDVPKGGLDYTVAEVLRALSAEKHMNDASCIEHIRRDIHNLLAALQSMLAPATLETMEKSIPYNLRRMVKPDAYVYTCRLNNDDDSYHV